MKTKHLPVLAGLSNVAILAIALSLFGTPLSAYSQESLGGSSQWPENLQSMYRELLRSRESLRQQYPDAQIPQELQSWLNRFTSDPFSDTQSLQGLGQLGQQLADKYNSAQLNQTDANQQQFDKFIHAVQNISGELTNGIAGKGTPSLSLDSLTKVHDTNQQWIDAKGKEIAAQYQKLNIDGVLVNLKNALQEIQQQQTQK